MCNGIVAAVSELEREYEGKLRFSVLSMESPGAAEVAEKHELGSHGMVALSATGDELGTIPGHDFGREEIVELIGTVLQ